MAPCQLIKVELSSAHAVTDQALAVWAALRVVDRHPSLRAGLAWLLLCLKIGIVWTASVHTVRRHDLMGLEIWLHAVLKAQVPILQQVFLITLDESPQVGVLRRPRFLEVFFDCLALGRAMLGGDARQVGIGRLERHAAVALSHSIVGGAIDFATHCRSIVVPSHIPYLALAERHVEVVLEV